MPGNELKAQSTKLKKGIKDSVSVVSSNKYLSGYIKRKVVDLAQFAVAILVMGTRFIIRNKLDVAGAGVSSKINKIKSTLPIRVLDEMVKNECLEYAGYLAYLNIFSLFSFIMVIISLFSLFGQEDAGLALLRYFIETLPRSSRSYIESQVVVMSKGATGLVSLTFLAAVWTITSTLEGLRTVFNKIFKVKNLPFFLISRLSSIGKVLLAIATMLVTVFTFMLLPKIIVYFTSISGVEVPNLLERPFLRVFVTFFIVSFLVASIYRSLTNEKLTILSVLPGAFITVSLWFLLGGQIFEFFSGGSGEYGDATGVLVVLLFFYVINLILLYGMQFNYMFSGSDESILIKDKMNAIFNRALSFIRFPRKREKEDKKRR